MKKYSIMEDEYDVYNYNCFEEDDYNEFSDDIINNEDNISSITKEFKSLNRKRNSFKIGIKKAKKFANIIKIKNNNIPIYKVLRDGIYRKTRIPEFNKCIKPNINTYDKYYKFIKNGGKFGEDVKDYLNEKISE